MHADTFFQELDFIKNSLSISLSKENYPWTFLFKNNKSIVKLKNNINLDRNSIISGFFNFDDAFYFIKCLANSSNNFIKAINLYSKKYPLVPLLNNTWLDCGISTNYFNAKKTITTQRVFNKLKIENGYVCKSSSMNKKIEAEKNWFANIPQDLALFTPHFYSKNDCYFTEYLYHNTLSELLVFGNLNTITWGQIFKSIKDFLGKIHLQKSNSLSDFNYFKKTKERLDKFTKESNFLLDKKIALNDLDPISINEILNSLQFKVQKIHCFIHGDFCFSNILYDFKSARIKVIDPRGMDFNSDITQFGDKNYDYAKLFHSIIGLYDFIIAKEYELNFFETKQEYKINFSIFYNENIRLIQREFINYFEFDLKEIYAITVTLFLSMLPLHNDDKQKQLALLSNAIRLYYELK